MTYSVESFLGVQIYSHTKFTITGIIIKLVTACYAEHAIFSNQNWYLYKTVFLFHARGVVVVVGLVDVVVASTVVVLIASVVVVGSVVGSVVVVASYVVVASIVVVITTAAVLSSKFKLKLLRFIFIVYLANGVCKNRWTNRIITILIHKYSG